MSRRSHVVRTDDQGGLATPRSLTGIEIFCATQNSGVSPESAAEITIASTRDYQRCFVSATIDDVYATVPDPPPIPGPGTWTVRFECPITVTDHWHSNPYYPSGAADTTLDEIRWAHTGPEPTPSGLDYAYLEKTNDYYPYWTFRETSGVLDGGGEPIDDSLYITVSWMFGPMWVELALSSPHGEFMQDVTISGGVGG